MERIKRLLTRRRVILIAIVSVFTVFGIGWVVITERRHNAFYRMAQAEGVVVNTRWGGPNIAAFRNVSYRQGLDMFIVVEEMCIGAAPSDARIQKCIPVSSDIYTVANHKFDDESLYELVKHLPNPDGVRMIWITNCEITADGIKCLAALPNLEEVMWIQPSEMEGNVSTVAQDLPFKVVTVRPETCKPFMQNTTGVPPVRSPLRGGME